MIAEQSPVSHVAADPDCDRVPFSSLLVLDRLVLAVPARELFGAVLRGLAFLGCLASANLGQRALPAGDGVGVLVGGRDAHNVFIRRRRLGSGNIAQVGRIGLGDRRLDVPLVGSTQGGRR